MPPATFIVYEKTGQWARCLRRRLAGKAIDVHEVRNVQACRELLSDAPKSIVAIEMAGDTLSVSRAIDQILSLGTEFPGMKWIVLADRAAQTCEPMLRELGAVHFIASTRRAGEVAHIVAKHLQNRQAVLSTSLADTLWRSIPWTNHNSHLPMEYE